MYIAVVGTLLVSYYDKRCTVNRALRFVTAVGTPETLTVTYWKGTSGITSAVAIPSTW
jgi:hypothetical protein